MLITRFVGESWDMLCDTFNVGRVFQKTGMGIIPDGADDDNISPQGAGDYVLNDDPEATQIDGAHMDGAVRSDDDNMDEEDARRDDANDEVLELEPSPSSLWDCNYEANPRYCTFANSWSTPCREHSTCLYLCTVLLLRLVHET